MPASDIWLLTAVALLGWGLNSVEASPSFGPKPEETLLVPGSIPLDTDGQEVRSPVPDLSDQFSNNTSLKALGSTDNSFSRASLGMFKQHGKTQSLPAFRLWTLLCDAADTTPLMPGGQL